MLDLVSRVRFGLAMVCCLGLLESAQGQLSVDFPEQPSVIQQAALRTKSEGIVSARMEAGRGRQIHVGIRLLKVDAETRRAIFESLGSGQVKTVTTHVPLQPSAPLLSDDERNHIKGTLSTGSTLSVSTCVMGIKQVESILNQIGQAGGSDVVRTPNVILLEGKEAEYSDITQRPLVVGVEQVEGGLKPDVQVLDEGTTIRMQAVTAGQLGQDKPHIRLNASLQLSRITSIQERQLFGLGDEPTIVQIPAHEVAVASAQETLVPGQTLLIDPYFSQEVELESDDTAPIFNKIPYVNKTFRNRTTNVEQYIMVLLQPTFQGN